MKKITLIALFVLLFSLQGCLLNAIFSGDSRLQLENGSRSVITDLEVWGKGGETKLLIGDTLYPGERSRTRDIGLDGLFRLRIVTGDSTCFLTGCAAIVDLGEVELGGSMRYRYVVDRDGPRLEER